MRGLQADFPMIPGENQLRMAFRFQRDWPDDESRPYPRKPNAPT